MKLNFLQSTKWEEFQKSQGKKTFRLKGDDFETFAILDHTPLGDYLFCPYGPVLKNKNALESAIKALKTLAQQQKAIFIRLEPQMYFAPNYMQKIGAKKVHDIEPAATWILDLTSPQEEILKGIEKYRRENPALYFCTSFLFLFFFWSKLQGISGGTSRGFPSPMLPTHKNRHPPAH